MRRDAVALAGRMDRSEVTAYQYGRHSRGGVTVYDFGEGFAVALNPGEPVPAWLAERFGAWRLFERCGGWCVWVSGLDGAL